jgi:hypothetical protein
VLLAGAGTDVGEKPTAADDDDDDDDDVDKAGTWGKKDAPPDTLGENYWMRLS